MNREVAIGASEHVAEPHRATADGRCSRCDVVWPCPSVIESCDVPPDTLPFSYPDDSMEGALRALVVVGRIVDSGRRRGRDKGRPCIVWVVPEFTSDETQFPSRTAGPLVWPPV